MRRLIVYKVVIIVGMLFALFMSANILQQRFYCKTPWRESDPIAFIPCEPIDRVMDQWHDYQDMARKYGLER